MDSFWSTGTGKKWKALTLFPARLREMAQELDRINGSLHFNPERWLHPRDQADAIKRRFRELPIDLRNYASYVELIVKKLPSIGAMRWSGKSQFYMPSVIQLSEFVEILTGKPRDQQVAELLNAAADALGEKGQIDALNIAQARSDLRKSKT